MPIGRVAAQKKEEFVRFIANTPPRPLPLFQSEPGPSCPSEEFKAIVKVGGEKYGNFDKVCKSKKKEEQ